VTTVAEIPDAVFDAACIGQTELRTEDLRAALAVAFAAGRASASEGAKTQWGIRHTGFKTVRITSDTNARSLLRNWVVPGEMVMREVGPWEVVATNADILARREGEATNTQES
jgi:hypothetical protein